MIGTLQYVIRLYKEWKEHGKIIIAVDYDDTIFNYALSNKVDRLAAISAIQVAKSLGAYIVIFTASPNSRHDEIRAYCKEIGLIIDSINKNPIELPYGNEGKIYYNINICDRSGLNEAVSILKQASEMYATYLP